MGQTDRRTSASLKLVSHLGSMQRHSKHKTNLPRQEASRVLREGDASRARMRRRVSGLLIVSSSGFIGVSLTNAFVALSVVCAVMSPSHIH